MGRAKAGRALCLAVFAVSLASCARSLPIPYKERVAGQLTPTIKSVQILGFKSQFKDEAGLMTGKAVDDQVYGKTVATALSDRVQQSGKLKIIPGDADLKKFTDSRDVMDALVNEGVMKPDVKDKLQKMSAADAIIVGEVSCSARKDVNPMMIGQLKLDVKTISAAATVNFRVYSVKTGESALSDSVTKSKGAVDMGGRPVDQIIMPLINQCADDFCIKLIGGDVPRQASMFATRKEPELKDIVDKLASGVAPDRIREELEGYQKAHPDSPNALFDLGVLRYIMGDKQAAAKMIEDAKMMKDADRNAFKTAEEDLIRGGPAKGILSQLLGG